jgi:hypothetical protein
VGRIPEQPHAAASVRPEVLFAASCDRIGTMDANGAIPGVPSDAWAPEFIGFDQSVPGKRRLEIFRCWAGVEIKDWSHRD